MNKLSKEQQTLLEHALEKLYTFLKEKYNVDYSGNINCRVYGQIIRLNQCSLQHYIAWEVNIWLKERRIYLITREFERKRISFSEGGYDLLYMSTNPKIFNLYF